MTRMCAACDSTVTYRYKGFEYWRNHDGHWLCQKCYCRYIKNPIMNPIIHKKWNPITSKKWNPILNKKYNPRRLAFKGKQLLLRENLKIGVCNLCRAVVPFDCKQTQMHHESYHDSNPLKDTIELCVRCHNRQRCIN